MKVSIDKILPNPDQPRTLFDQGELEALAESIKQHGIIQPPVVFEFGDWFMLVDGERRLRAAKLAGLTDIDVVIKDDIKKNTKDRLLKAMVANIQRSQMGPVDEGRAYERLMLEMGNLEAVAESVGVSTATVSLRISLLEFHDQVQTLFNQRRLPLDLIMIAALKRLKREQQIRIAGIAATRGLTGASIKRLIKLEAKKGQWKAHQPRKRTTSADVVQTVVSSNGHFSALYMIGEKKLPESIRMAALETCRACPLYDDASPSSCRQCPLPDFLVRVHVDKRELDYVIGGGK